VVAPALSVFLTSKIGFSTKLLASFKTTVFYDKIAIQQNFHCLIFKTGQSYIS
jgi:hypothetical protein